MNTAVSKQTVLQRTRIIANLQETFATLLGLRTEEVPVEETFLTLGADSLLLLQASHVLQKNFGVTVPFRLLVDNLSTIEALADYIEPKLGPLPAPVQDVASGRPAVANGQPSVMSQPKQEIAAAIQQSQAMSAAPCSPASNQNVPALGIETLLLQQLQIMSQQLLLLAGSSPVEVAPLPTTPEVLPVPEVAPLPLAEPASVSSSSDTAMVPDTFVPYKALKKETRSGFTPAQQRSLDALIARFSAKTAGSKRMADEYRPYLADNRLTAGFRMPWKELCYPLVIERGAGSHVWDIDGNEYIDLTSGFGALLFGHTPEFLTSALHQQLEKGVGLGWQSQLAGKVAMLITELTGTERVAFCNSGTEAVMSALRLARAATGRSKIALFESSYHGTFDGVLVKRAEVSSDGKTHPAPIAPGIPPSMLQDVIVLEYDSERSFFDLEKHGAELAAVIVELPRSRRPDVHPGNFLRRLRTLTERLGIVLIFDEVVTGFRFHPGGAQALFGVQADLVTYGKAAGAGVPVGIIAGKRRIMDAIDGGTWQFGDASFPEAVTTYYAGTFFKHPLIMPALWASLNHIKKHGARLQEELDGRTERLTIRLNDFFKSQGYPIKVDRFGSLFRFVFHRDVKFHDLFFYYLAEKGVYICETRNSFLNTAHTEEDMEKIFQAMRESMDEMRRAGFLPGGDRADASASEEPASAHGKTGLSLPVTEPQKQLLLLSQFSQDASVAYNLSFIVRLTGALNVDALRRALRALVERHEALRTHFAESGDAQIVSPAAQAELEMDDLRAHTPQQVQDWRSREARQSFNLYRGPLIRLRLGVLGHSEHLLMVTTHHSVTDGVSMGVFFRELANLYAAECNGRPAGLPPAGRYSEYVLRQVEAYESDQMKAAESYWLQAFSSGVPVLKLPTTFRRPAIMSFKGARARIRSAEAVQRAVGSLSQTSRCTSFMVLLAGYTVMLSRLSGQNEVVIGVPAAGQFASADSNLIGYCINLLPLRLDCIGDESFTDLLSRVKDAVLNSYEHQRHPLNRLIRKLEIRPDSARPALVPVLFNQDRPTSSLSSAGLTLEILPQETGTAQFELDLNVQEVDGEMVLECEYSTDLFDHTTVVRWLGHFETILQSAASDPHSRIKDLTLLTAAEQQQLIRNCNDTQREYPSGTCFHTLLEAQARRIPGHVAVSDLHHSYSYQELNRKADNLAGYLRKRRVGPEEPVAIRMQRSPEMLMAILAVFKAGACYLPLDSAWPAHRTRQVLDDAGVRIMLADEPASEVVSSGCELLNLKTDFPADEDGSASMPLAVHWRQLAYIIYTSGSTGVPKGAMVEHRGMLNHLCCKIADLRLNSSDVIAETSSPCFDISVWQFLAVLLVGGTVRILPDSVLQSPAALFRQMEQEITVLEMVPSLLRIVLDDDEISRNQKLRLRWMIVTGEEFPLDLATRWFSRFPNVPIVNAYGPTECSDDVTHHQLEKGPPEDGIRVPIGRAVMNTQLYVVDHNWQLCPPQVPGELWIGGDGVGRGYLGHPELTAQSFVPDCFGGREGSRLYRTGDLVRHLPGGELVFLGRLDHQVKIRGFRMELGEIEAAVKAHPQIHDAVIIARDDQNGIRRLVAYVIPSEKDPGLSDSLKASLKQKLPEYMVPAAFVLCDLFPLTANGKLDRNALPAPRFGAQESLEFVAPGNATERALAGIWQLVLGVERVGIHDNFFELGGDSILGIQIAARAAKENLRLNPRHLFQYPTVAELASMAEPIQEAHAEHGGEGQVSGPVLLTPVQQWFFEEGFSQQHHWNQSAMLEVDAAVDSSALESAFAHLVAHHDALRMRFHHDGTRWEQRYGTIHEAPAPKLLMTDVSGLSGQEKWSAIEAACTRLQSSLDLQAGRLLQPALFHIGDGQAKRLFLPIHHLVVDAVSWPILLETLATAYQQIVAGSKVDLGPKSTSFQRWAQLLKDYASSSELKNEIGYWTGEEWKHVQPLPLDFPNGENTEASAEYLLAELDQDETAAMLREVPKAWRVLVNDLLLAAVARCFAAWTGSRSLLVDVEGHGRESLFPQVDLSRTVGWFTTIAPLRLDLGNDDLIVEQVKRIKQQVRSLPNAGIGHGVLRYFGPEHLRRQIQAFPGAGIAFNYMGRMGQAGVEQSLFRHIDAPRGLSHSAAAHRSYAIEINGGISDGRLQLYWAYSRNLHTAETIERLVEGFLAALREMIACANHALQPVLTPSDFPHAGLSQTDLDELLTGQE
jgi:amino acid adenylation domain-containing protein/non-ribosomal peptide synthase protein (TIGR01720 family)